MLLGGLSAINSIIFLKRTIDNRSILKIIYNRTVHSEVHDVVGPQGGLCFRNITGFHGTHVNFTSRTTVSKVRSSLPRFSGKLIYPINVCGHLLLIEVYRNGIKKIIKYGKNFSSDLRYSTAFTAPRFWGNFRSLSCNSGQFYMNFQPNQWRNMEIIRI
jgi:hypothetical protein